jgi:ABC-type bacteriocin/lantibiotic exporter with double-glycine peptidase domain
MAEAHDTRLLAVSKNLLTNLKVPFTPTILKKKLESNPYYPSLYSISAVLNDYKIENKSLRVERSQIEELQAPFLAYLLLPEIGSEDFVSVNRVSEKTVTYYHGKEKTISKEEFMSNWSWCAIEYIFNLTLTLKIK